MEPRFGDRGTACASSPALADALQWSRGSVTAERKLPIMLLRNQMVVLQWSRGSVTAERQLA